MNYKKVIVFSFIVLIAISFSIESVFASFDIGEGGAVCVTSSTTDGFCRELASGNGAMCFLYGFGAPCSTAVIME